RWGGLAIALLAPLLVPALREARTGGFVATPRSLISFYSLNLLHPVLPNLLHPLFRGLRQPMSYALGCSAILLATIGLRHARRRGAFWALMAVAFFCLALGPYLQLLGHQWDLWFLPYNLLY